MIGAVGIGSNKKLPGLDIGSNIQIFVADIENH